MLKLYDPFYILGHTSRNKIVRKFFFFTICLTLSCVFVVTPWTKVMAKSHYEHTCLNCSLDCQDHHSTPELLFLM